VLDAVEATGVDFRGLKKANALCRFVELAA